MIQSYRNHLNVSISLPARVKSAAISCQNKSGTKEGRFLFQYQSTVKANSDNPAQVWISRVPGCPCKGKCSCRTFLRSSLRYPARAEFPQLLTHVGDRNSEFLCSGKWLIKILPWTLCRMWHFSAVMDSGSGEWTTGKVWSQITWKGQRANSGASVQVNHVGRRFEASSEFIPASWSATHRISHCVMFHCSLWGFSGTSHTGFRSNWDLFLPGSNGRCCECTMERERGKKGASTEVCEGNGDRKYYTESWVWVFVGQPYPSSIKISFSLKCLLFFLLILLCMVDA